LIFRNGDLEKSVILKVAVCLKRCWGVKN